MAKCKSENLLFNSVVLRLLVFWHWCCCHNPPLPAVVSPNEASGTFGAHLRAV